jgi:hypothetical protein
MFCGSSCTIRKADEADKTLDGAGVYSIMLSLLQGLEGIGCQLAVCGYVVFLDTSRCNMIYKLHWDWLWLKLITLNRASHVSFKKCAMTTRPNDNSTVSCRSKEWFGSVGWVKICGSVRLISGPRLDRLYT